MRLNRHPSLVVAAIVLLGTATSGCGESPAATPTERSAAALAVERMGDVQGALDTWRDAETVSQAHRAAEAVSNLVTGPAVDLFGDADGDGVVSGAVDVGLLPGEAGESSLGMPLVDCAGGDLLGDSWDDPAARWADLRDKIEAWSPSDNPFPQLSSHAQRVVGWAQLTLGSDDLVDAQEYSGHAQLHVDASLAAIAECR